MTGMFLTPITAMSLITEMSNKRLCLVYMEGWRHGAGNMSRKSKAFSGQARDTYEEGYSRGQRSRKIELRGAQERWGIVEAQIYEADMNTGAPHEN